MALRIPTQKTLPIFDRPLAVGDKVTDGEKVMQVSALLTKDRVVVNWRGKNYWTLEINLKKYVKST